MGIKFKEDDDNGDDDDNNDDEETEETNGNVDKVDNDEIRDPVLNVNQTYKSEIIYFFYLI